MRPVLIAESVHSRLDSDRLHRIMSPGRAILAKALKQHPVGLEGTDDGIWALYLGAVLLGQIDGRAMKVYE